MESGNVEHKKKYAKSFTKISHLTEEEKKLRLQEQKRLWARKYLKSSEYKKKHAFEIHKKHFRRCLKELLQNDIQKMKSNKKAQYNTLKKDIQYLQKQINKIVCKLQEIQDEF